MNPDELTSSQLDCVFRTTDALHGYIVEMHKSHTDNKELLKALEHIEKALGILSGVEADHIQLMYGPPEVMFSPKELAEMRLRDEVMQQVKQADLTAEQWKELVADLAADENIDFRIIKDLIEEKPIKL